MAELLHVIDAAGWSAATGSGRLACPPGGFIHLCTQGQLGFVLGRHFAGRTGLVVLHVEAEGLDLRWEASEPGMDPFPHCYGDIPVAAVRRSDPV